MFHGTQCGIPFEMHCLQMAPDQTRWHCSQCGEPPYKGENPILPTADLELEGQLAGGLLQGTGV